MSSPLPESHTYTARWVFPVAGPPLPNGTVTVQGDRIEAVEPRGARTADTHLGNVAIVPGLVNAHTHLDLSGARGLIPPTDPDHFTDWLRGVIAYRRGRTPELVREDIATGLAECLRFGTTLTGDISVDGGSWDAVAESQTRAVVFREMIGFSPERATATLEETKRWLDAHPDTPVCRTAVSPHAPYSAFPPLYSMAWVWGRMMATHLAETAIEVRFLLDRRGPVADFLKELGIAADQGTTYETAGYLRVMRRVSRALIAHGNYLPGDSPIAANQSIVYCPRTHAAFGHPPHPFREFLARGVRVCLGTDSLASNPDLDILAEARFVRQRYPDFPGDTLLRMVTLSGAEALDWADESGSLEAGKSADFVAVPLPNHDPADPHELLFADHPGDRRTLFRGTWRGG
jgi:cytosine/adenosine deaminase-related metal-dependent hydrolase